MSVNEVPVRESNLESGHSLHLFFDGTDWDVWLDTEIGEHDGLCIASGKSIATVIEKAESVLELCAKRCRDLL